MAGHFFMATLWAHGMKGTLVYRKTFGCNLKNRTESFARYFFTSLLRNVIHNKSAFKRKNKVLIYKYSHVINSKKIDKRTRVRFSTPKKVRVDIDTILTVYEEIKKFILLMLLKICIYIKK